MNFVCNGTTNRSSLKKMCTSSVLISVFSTIRSFISRISDIKLVLGIDENSFLWFGCGDLLIKKI